MRLTRLFPATSATAIALVAFSALCNLGGSAFGGVVEIFISVPDQSLAVLQDGEVLGKFRVSTSKFGLGDTYGSYKTPLGDLRVCDKVGGGLAPGSVLSGRHATGEVLPPNAKGRDPIVTRILWLDGCEAANQHARSRGIYIHGTAEEKYIGRPMSYGCIRMRSEDVLKVYDLSPVGTPVRIETRKLSAIIKPRLEERDTRVAAERASAKAAKLAIEKAEREMEAAAKLLAKNNAAAEAENAGKKEKKTASSETLMKGSILDYEAFRPADTVPSHGGEVQLRADAALVAGPPSPKRMAMARKR